MSASTAAWVLVVSSLALPAMAQVHRWVDEQGRVHYGDRPLGATGTTLRIRAESATAPQAAPAATPRATVAPLGAKPPAGSPATSDIDRELAHRRAAPPGAPAAQSPGMAALVAQCKANRGVDCDTPQGMRTLQRENTPPTREEQARIAGLRARRANCARAPGALGC